MKISNYLGLLGLFFSALSLNAQTPCVAGFAGAYPCEDVDMLAHVLKPNLGGGNMNDIWGWTDPLDGKEYVILGRTNGTSFLDISDPINPIYLGTLPPHTSNSTWRDIKTYGNYAFIVSEAGGHGMQVFDLTQLRNVMSPPLVFTESAHYGAFGNCHNIAINEATARAYAVGTNTFAGGLHIVDISDPLNPVIAGDYALDGYSHDSQVVNYIGPDPDYVGAEIAFNFNEDAVTIANVSDPTDTQTISINGYAGSQYTHQGWVTEDHRYLLSNDELDEYYNGVNTTTFIWDIQDLDNPVLIGTFVNATTSIDHNLYTRGNLCYQSNYRSGLRILDMTDIANANLNEVAFFDVYPASNSANFNGTWSNYPYFESGVVAVSHIEDGLFLLKPVFLRVTPAVTSLCSSDDVTLNISVEDGFAGPIHFDLSGLPVGASVSFSSNDISSPASVTATITGLPANTAMYNITVSAEGASYTYSETVSLDVTGASAWFLDSDEDTFGDPTSMVEDCVQPLGYVDNADDCDDSRNDVYPGATGTQEGIDNDCNGLVEGDESLFCPGDFNFDGVRNISDLLIFLSDLGCTGPSCSADFNEDLVVNTADLNGFLAVYGSNCN